MEAETISMEEIMALEGPANEKLKIDFPKRFGEPGYKCPIDYCYEEGKRIEMVTKEYDITNGQFSKFFIAFTTMRLACNERSYDLREPSKCIAVMRVIYEEKTPTLTKKEKDTALQALIEINYLAGEDDLAESLQCAWNVFTGNAVTMDFLQDLCGGKMKVYDLH